MNFSQEARIQHVSKHFPCYPEKISNLPKQLPNLFNLALLKIKQKKKKKSKPELSQIFGQFWKLLTVLDIPFLIWKSKKLKKK